MYFYVHQINWSLKSDPLFSLQQIIQVAFFAFTALFVFLLLKDNKSEMGFLVILAAGIGIFLYMIGQLAEVIEFIKDIANKANLKMRLVQANKCCDSS